VTWSGKERQIEGYHAKKIKLINNIITISSVKVKKYDAYQR
jgi:hypothetical protein